MTTLYVHISEQCRKDAKKHSVTGDLKSLADKLETAQSDRGLEHFPKPYRKKSMGRHGRLVIEEHRRGSTLLLCFVRYLIRGGAEYGAFCNDTEAYYARHRTTDEAVERIIGVRSQQPIASKPLLPAAETNYLQQPSILYQPGQEEVLLEGYLESDEWCKRLSKHWLDNHVGRGESANNPDQPETSVDTIDTYLNAYYDLIYTLETDSIPLKKTSIFHPDNPAVGILFRQFPHLQRTILIAPISRKEASDETELRQRYARVLNGNDLDEKELMQHSHRFYPALIPYDRDIWKKIERSGKANLPLSREEHLVIESVSGSGIGQNEKYPLFINGRPGSGKSTILQFLFADHLARFLALREIHGVNYRELISPPLYLTYSDQLREEAKATVKEILTSSAKTFEDGLALPDDIVLDDLLRASFQHFRSFLQSQLPEEIESQFADDHCVDFNRFRRHLNDWLKHHPNPTVRKKVTPGLAWHVIRTFIKGIHREANSVIDPECYRSEISRDTKSVSDEMFSLIYEQIWQSWYQPLCEKDNLWDDQDLVRAVLLHAEEKLSQYPAVFCDESQDFTHIELELIEQLSVYSKYDIPGYLAKAVPFAFAGDPFQTLNPTGFDWGTLQASFHDKIAKQLDPSGEANLQFNFKNLAFNYRSSEHIVKLANLVHLLRGVLLSVKNLNPQQSWTIRNTVKPTWFDWHQADWRAHLQEEKENVTIIVPCQENGEVDYVLQDAFLSELALQRDEQGEWVLEEKSGKPAIDPHMDVISPAKAKGLEFDWVVLYGFGQAALPPLTAQIENLQQSQIETPSPAQKLEWEYFINRLYVAVSRARKRLLVFDPDVAWQHFWSFAQRSQKEKLLQLYASTDWKMEALGDILLGDEETWQGEKNNPADVAEQYCSKGKAERDADLMMRASANFTKANMTLDAGRCRALSYEYTEQFDRAAAEFVTLKMSSAACRCYWATQNMAAVTVLVEQFPDLAVDARFVAADVLERDRNTPQEIRNTLSTLATFTPASFTEDPNELPTWRWFFAQFVVKIANTLTECEVLTADIDTQQRWENDIDQVIEIIKQFALPIVGYPQISKLLYLVGPPQKALDMLEHCQQSDVQQIKTDALEVAADTEESWVWRAHTQVDHYPSNVRYYYLLKDYAGAVDQWIAANRSINKETPLRLLLLCAANLKDVESIKRLLPFCTELVEILETLDCLKQSTINELSGALSVAIAHSLVIHSNWKATIKFASDGLRWKNILGFANSDSAVIQNARYMQLTQSLEKLVIHWSAPMRTAALVRVIARDANTLKDSTSKVAQYAIPRLLKKALIVEPKATAEKQASVRILLRHISMEEAGLALEHAFGLGIAMEFYEQFFQTGSLAYFALPQTTAQTNYAKRRWLATLQSLGETKGGKAGETHKTRAGERAKDWRISEASVKESKRALAALSPIIPVSADSDVAPMIAPPIMKPVEKPITVGDRLLRVEQFRAKHSLVLTDIKTQQQVECSDRVVTSQSVNVEAGKFSLSGSEWSVPEWNLICETQISPASTLIKLRHSDRTLVAMYEFAASSKLQVPEKQINNDKSSEANLSPEQQNRRHRHQLRRRGRVRARSGFRR